MCRVFTQVTVVIIRKSINWYLYDTIEQICDFVCTHVQCVQIILIDIYDQKLTCDIIQCVQMLQLYTNSLCTVTFNLT